MDFHFKMFCGWYLKSPSLNTSMFFVTDQLAMAAGMGKSLLLLNSLQI